MAKSLVENLAEEEVTPFPDISRGVECNVTGQIGSKQAAITHKRKPIQIKLTYSMCVFEKLSHFHR